MKEFEVLKARTTKNENIIMFDIRINGVKIYGMMLKHVISEKNGKEYDIISYPSHQGSDGKYYNYCYYDLSEADRKNIIDQVNELL